MPSRLLLRWAIALSFAPMAHAGGCVYNGACGWIHYLGKTADGRHAVFMSTTKSVGRFDVSPTEAGSGQQPIDTWVSNGNSERISVSPYPAPYGGTHILYSYNFPESLGNRVFVDSAYQSTGGTIYPNDYNPNARPIVQTQPPARTPEPVTEFIPIKPESVTTSQLAQPEMPELAQPVTTETLVSTPQPVLNIPVPQPVAIPPSTTASRPAQGQPPVVVQTLAQPPITSVTQARGIKALATPTTTASGQAILPPVVRPQATPVITSGSHAQRPVVAPATSATLTVLSPQPGTVVSTITPSTRPQQEPVAAAQVSQQGPVAPARLNLPVLPPVAISTKSDTTGPIALPPAQSTVLVHSETKSPPQVATQPTEQTVHIPVIAPPSITTVTTPTPIVTQENKPVVIMQTIQPATQADRPPRRTEGGRQYPVITQVDQRDDPVRITRQLNESMARPSGTVGGLPNCPARLHRQEDGRPEHANCLDVAELQSTRSLGPPLHPGRQWEDPDWNTWIELRNLRTTDSRDHLDLHAEAKMATAGVDRHWRHGIVTGLMVGHEWQRSQSFSGLLQSRSEGTLIGPYLAYRVADHWVLDAALTYEQQRHQQRLIILTGEYASRSTAIGINAVGQYQVGEATLVARVGTHYQRQHMAAYTLEGNFLDLTLKLDNPASRFTSRTYNFGAEINRTFFVGGHRALMPYAILEASYDRQHDPDKQVVTGGTSRGGTAPWSGQAKLGIRSSLSNKTSLEGSAAYMSVGQTGLRVWEYRVLLSHSL